MVQLYELRYLAGFYAFVNRQNYHTNEASIVYKLRAETGKSLLKAVWRHSLKDRYITNYMRESKNYHA